MKEKIKVMHLIWSMATGGAQKVVMNYLRDFQNDPDIELKLFVYTGRDDNSFNREIQEKHYPVTYLNNPKSKITIPYIKRYFNWRIMIKNWEKAIHAYQPDIVHVHISALLTTTMEPIAEEKVPVRFDTLHSDPYRYKGRALAVNRKAFTQNGFIPICITNEQVPIAQKRYGFVRYEILHNGVDFSNLRKSMITKEEARKQLGIPSDAFLVAGVGRLNVIKNYPLLLDAFHILLTNKRNAILVIAGDGPERLYLQEKVRREGMEKQVHFLGNLASTVPVYCAADILGLTSLSESSSIVALEAQACHLRCVLSAGVPKESIISNTARRMEKGASAEQWANALVDMSYVSRPTCSESEYEVHAVSVKLKQIYLKYWGEYQNAGKKVSDND